jgi:uncharacterized protein (DUF2147 family)
MLRPSLYIAVLCLFGVSQAQIGDIVGKWKTIDDVTGEARSVVEIYKRGDEFFGKIESIITNPGEDPDPVCEECDSKDPRYMQKVIGMESIQNLKYDRKENDYENGTILDPENGNVYDCRIWIENGKLKVRGYVYFLYRTQTWLPHDG